MFFYLSWWPDFKAGSYKMIVEFFSLVSLFSSAAALDLFPAGIVFTIITYLFAG
jgi:hypothetical protein